MPTSWPRMFDCSATSADATACSNAFTPAAALLTPEKPSCALVDGAALAPTSRSARDLSCSEIVSRTRELTKPPG